jgi:hypothetical protein
MSELTQPELIKYFPKRIPADGRTYLDVLIDMCHELEEYLNTVYKQVLRTMPLLNYIAQKATEVYTACAKAKVVGTRLEESYLQKQILIMCVLFDEIRPPYIEEMELFYGLHPENGYGYWYIQDFSNHGNPIIGGFTPPDSGTAQVM